MTLYIVTFATKTSYVRAILCLKSRNGKTMKEKLAPKKFTKTPQTGLNILYWSQVQRVVLVNLLLLLISFEYKI